METKKKDEVMQENSQKRGIALGAILALFASIFVGTAPASAATTNGADIALTPTAGSVSNFNGSILEDFPMVSYLLPGVSNDNFAAYKVRYEVTRVSGNVDIIVGTTSATAISDAADRSSWSAGFSTVSAVVQSDWTTASQFTPHALDSSAARLVIRAYTSSSLASLSEVTAVVSVKVWVENTATNNNIHDELEMYTTKTITLHAVSAFPSSGSIASLDAGDTVITASGTVTALNFANLGGKFYLAMASTNTTFSVSGQAGATTINSSILTANNMASRSGVVSQSFTVSSSDGVNATDSVSGRIQYQIKYDTLDYTYSVGATFSAVAAGSGVQTLYANAVAGDDATNSGATATVRTNTTTTFRIGAASSSGSVSKAVSIALLSGPTLTANSKYISVNGGASTASWPSVTAPISVTTGTDGFGTFTLTNTGFIGNESVTLKAFVGNVSKSITVNFEASTFSLTPVYTTYQTAAGTALDISWTVKDQWLKSSTRADQRLKIVRSGVGFNYSPTLSYVTVGSGVATLNFVPQAATATGSAKVDATLQELNVNTGGYVDTSITSTQVEVNVSVASNAFSTGLAASRSASISYFPSTVSWVTVTGKVANTGSAVAVSGPGLVFRDATGATYSSAVTVRAGSGPQYSFDVAGTTAGTFTMTLTNGTATTTSLVIVDPASHAAGAAINFDTTEIQAGRTKIITGTVVDVNGNPVDTTQGDGTASIVVTYAGTAGIPVGSMPTETDADGKFRVSVLTSATDNGSFTLTAVYLKNGSTTAVADKVTKVQTISVGEATASVSDQKVNAGSFKGYVAVYAKGYEGQRLSAKVGNDWVVVPALASNFVRVVEFTGAGYTIAVRIYIDRVLVDTITVTTK